MYLIIQLRQSVPHGINENNCRSHNYRPLFYGTGFIIPLYYHGSFKWVSEHPELILGSYFNERNIKIDFQIFVFIFNQYYALTLDVYTFMLSFNMS